MRLRVGVPLNVVLSHHSVTCCGWHWASARWSRLHGTEGIVGTKETCSRMFISNLCIYMFSFPLACL